MESFHQNDGRPACGNQTNRSSSDVNPTSTPEGRSEALQAYMRVAGEVTSHQVRIVAQLRFFTSVITMLHNSPEGIPDKAIYSIVGHSFGKDDQHFATQ